MAMLFEHKERLRFAPMQHGENEYAFYDSSARPEFDVYRALVNGWIGQLPEAEQGEMIARFRKSDNAAYQATLAELTIFAALRCQGYTVEIHPPSGHPTRKPDFLAKNECGEAVAFIEITTFGPAQEDAARSNREAAIYNAIDKVRLPEGWHLGYDVVVYGTASPNLGKLCHSIETWAAESAGSDPRNKTVKQFDADDWRIELTLIGGFKTDMVAEHSIGFAMGDVRFVSASLEIREALEKKGDRYGVLEAPFLIVVADCKNELTGGESNKEALLDAVFGTSAAEITTLPSGEIAANGIRRRDGYWGWPGKPKHQNVSGVLLLPQPGLWDLRSARWQPLILRHPWAEHPLPTSLLPLPGWQLTEKDKFIPNKGTALADILELPEVWPPAEA
jgi:hypothetical protein